MWFWAIAAVSAAAGDGAPGAPTGGAPPGGGLMSPLMLIALMFGFMYFIMWRPQQKREQERRNMWANLAKNDTVVTQGGIYGKIVKLGELTVVLRVAENPNVDIEFLRQAVSKVVNSEEIEKNKKAKSG